MPEHFGPGSQEKMKNADPDKMTPLDALAVRLHETRCPEQKRPFKECRGHEWHIKDAREALRWVAEQMPGREEVVKIVKGVRTEAGGPVILYWHEAGLVAAALRAFWRERLGVGKGAGG